MDNVTYSGNLALNGAADREFRKIQSILGLIQIGGREVILG
jgi:hypothetical protein